MASKFQEKPLLTGNNDDERRLRRDLEKHADADIFVDDPVWVDLRGYENDFDFVMKAIVVQVNAQLQSAIVRITTNDGTFLRRVEPEIVCLRTVAAIAIETTTTA